MNGDPIDGPALLLAAAKASVGPQLLPDLVDHVQAHLGPRLDEYRRRYELVHESDDACLFLVEADHWETIDEHVELERRERDAVERAHEEHLRRLGDSLGRSEEFETALEIRTCVVVGKNVE
ncbi:hypothetical protein [Halomarina oriensis]|uniref:DUF8048 domain-containing protein n=1 Tax=Halomarina oriensis TaxID=671145 RepID=A0A6B0GGR5_9EURY|nr:hypothetical protein [Halomarina oriensis]MWG34052.1 hypothetical protein [Halomarina oriensis]